MNHMIEDNHCYTVQYTTYINLLGPSLVKRYKTQLKSTIISFSYGIYFFCSLISVSQLFNTDLKVDHKFKL